MKKNEKRKSLPKLLWETVILMAVVGFVGRECGRELAIQHTQQGSISQNAPTGFRGAEWLMSMADVKSLFPFATEMSPEMLRFRTDAFSRPAGVYFMFNDDELVMVNITFRGEKTEDTYRQTHPLVVQKYGAMPEPSRTREQKLMSRKSVGKVTIAHLLHEKAGIQMEQVLLYLVERM